MPLLTVGHGTLTAAGLTSLLTSAAVDRLVDVRRFPASRRSPHLAREPLAHALATQGIGYRWDERLGGRRSLPVGEVVEDPWWNVEAFRAYAAHTRTPGFLEAMGELLADSAAGTTVIMCSETVWWRCHRRLIGDVVTLGHGGVVDHLMPTGRRTAHPVAAGARVHADGLVHWDGPATDALP